MVGVAYSYINYTKGTDIFICDVASGMLVHSHPLNNTFPLSNRIWTHGGSKSFLPRTVLTAKAWELPNFTPPHVDSPSFLKAGFWYGTLGIPDTY